MTTEDDFQAALDAQPDHWQTRLVFADWLDERGDVRAAGYRELGRLRLNPVLCIQSSGGQRHYIVGDSGAPPSAELQRQYHACLLPQTWFRSCRKGDGFPENEAWKFYDTRRAADDAAALAFTQLPAEQRAALG